MLSTYLEDLPLVSGGDVLILHTDLESCCELELGMHMPTTRTICLFMKSFLYRSGSSLALIFPVSLKTNFSPVNL